MFNITNERDLLQYLTININEYIEKDNYYTIAYRFYNTYLKETDLVKIKIKYPVGEPYIMKTDILNKAEALNILKILTDKSDGKNNSNIF